MPSKGCILQEEKVSANKTAMSNIDKLLLDAERADLKAEKLELQADRAEFKAMQQAWEATKSVGSCNCKVSHGQLEAERLQLEKEKSQLRLAQIQLKAAQSQLEEATSKLETAQTQLEEARNQLEIARKHLEAAKGQMDVDKLRLEAAKASLVAAKNRFEAATEQLKDAKSKFVDAKTRLEAAAASNATMGSDVSARLEEENGNLQVQVGQLLSDMSKLRSVLSEMENNKLKLETDLSESRGEVQRLKTENSKDDQRRLEDELKNCRAELEQFKKETKKHEERVPMPKSNNPVVFMAFTIRGVPVGRIVMELFADTTPIVVENFRALCTGEKGMGRRGEPLHYKGRSIYFVMSDKFIYGGYTTSWTGNNNGESIYGDILPVENFIRKHTGPGDLTMANIGTNYCDGCGFIIRNVKDTSRDGVNVVIGKIIEGMDVFKLVLSAFSDSQYPTYGSLMIADCGQLS